MNTSAEYIACVYSCESREVYYQPMNIQMADGDSS